MPPRAAWLAGAGRRYFNGIGWLAGTGTAVTLFFGLPSINLSE